MKTLKNRNYQRIDNKIIEAYKKELLNGTANSVTVTNLCKEADINRTTFYKHYEETNDIFLKLQDQFVDEYFTFNEEEFNKFLKNQREYLNNLANRMKPNINLIEKLMGPDHIYRVISKIGASIITGLKKHFPEVFKKHGETALYTEVLYFIGGTLALAIALIKKDFAVKITLNDLIEQVATSWEAGRLYYQTH